MFFGTFAPLRYPDCPEVELTEFGVIAEKCIKQLDSFYEHISVEQYVIMPNHIHLLLYVKSEGQSRTPVPTRANSPFSQFISTYKRFSNKEYGENIWQSRSYDHVIRNYQDYEAHLLYILENPRNWMYDEMFAE